MSLRIFIGWDGREHQAFSVAYQSMHKKAVGRLDVEPIGLIALSGYVRPTSVRNGSFYDDISDAPMSTAHAIARFFIPTIAERAGWAVFMDADVLLRRNIAELFALADPRYALQVVKHSFTPTADTKKGGDVQLPYPRKNWSSVMLFNLAHPAHNRLTLELLNSAPGRDLHNFCWLQDDEIGGLPEQWNWLVNHSQSPDPALVHFTEGVPTVKGHECDPFAYEWTSYLPQRTPHVIHRASDHHNV